MERGGGPRPSTLRIAPPAGAKIRSSGQGAISAGAWSGAVTGAETRDASVSAALTVSTHWHSDGQTWAPPRAGVGRAEAGQLPSWAPRGDTQQQNQSVVPQVRPSHCQVASASGAQIETSRVKSASRQIDQKDGKRLTALL